MKKKLITLLSTILIVVVSLMGVDICFAAMSSESTFGLGLIGLCVLVLFWFFLYKYVLLKIKLKESDEDRG